MRRVPGRLVAANVRGPAQVLQGKLLAAEALLKLGADVTIAEKDGYTPMHGAGFLGRAKIATLLFEHGVALDDARAPGG